MLKRLSILLAPVEPPAAALGKWEKALASCLEWEKAKQDRLSRWAGDRGKLKEKSEEQYLEGKNDLLLDLTKAGKAARKSLLALERLYHPASKIPRSHIYAPDRVIAKLDGVYCEHYRATDYTLKQCFTMMGSSKQSKMARKHYEVYLAAVGESLGALSSDAEFQVAFEGDHLWAVGLKYAGSKLIPLFAPVEGRVCLPLPTHSMLEDLLGCLDVHENIVGEVLYIFLLPERHADYVPRLAAGLMVWESI